MLNENENTIMQDSDSTEHDDMLFNMLKECKTLPIFLNRIFGFLQRRTDFYLVAKEPNSPVGLPEGLAEYLVKHTYLNWMPKDKDKITILSESEVPQVFAEEEVIADDVVTEEIVETMENFTLEKNCQAEPSKQKVAEIKTNTDFVHSEYYNGAVFDKYCWTQSITEVDVTVKVSENVSSKDIKVSILPMRISVKLGDSVLLEGELCQKCKHHDAIWSLDNQKLQIHLDKCREMWWDCLIQSEEKLDISKLDCTRPFEDLPEEAKAKIEELGWNQERKRLGLPTSDELAKQDILKKAWNVEGSPFSGPFDPSQVSFH